jgi:two-component system cell cycle response regulator
MNSELINRILQSPRLPSLPTVAMDLIILVQKENASIDPIASTIQYDPGLSSKVLKTVNSSFTAKPTPSAPSATR